jgi:hypothetical protein
MKRPKRDPVREDRIYNEAIVDARPEEQAMSWYYYLEGKITFPFRGRCFAANAVSPLRKGETVEVLRMAVEDACEHDMLVQIRWQGRKMAVPLSQLEAINPDESTRKPSATGITGFRRVTASDLRTVAESSRRSSRQSDSAHQSAGSVSSWKIRRGCRNEHSEHARDRVRRASGFVVCWACSAAWRCKSSGQPDGGEGLEMMQGLPPRGGV